VCFLCLYFCNDLFAARHADPGSFNEFRFLWFAGFVRLLVVGRWRATMIDSLVIGERQ
jgi:hypothetical protein